LIKTSDLYATYKLPLNC